MQQRAPDIKAGIFSQYHGNDIRTAAGRPDVKQDTAEPREGSAMAKQSSSMGWSVSGWVIG